MNHRQPARSIQDPGPSPGNTITSWQQNQKSFLTCSCDVFGNLIDNIQCCTEVRWKISERNGIKHLTWTRGCVCRHKETFAHKQPFPLCRGVWRGAEKRLQPTAARWKTQGGVSSLENSSRARRLTLRSQMILSSDETGRLQKDAPPKAAAKQAAQAGVFWVTPEWLKAFIWNIITFALIHRGRGRSMLATCCSKPQLRTPPSSKRSTQRRTTHGFYVLL